MAKKKKRKLKKPYRILKGIYTAIVVLAALIVVMNLVSDIMYKVVDPRITLE